MAAMNVYQCIAAVSAEIAQTGIGKNRKNEQQQYNFRGIDDVYNALAPVMAKHGLVVIPRIIGRQVTERVNKHGTALFYVMVEAQFDFVSAADGSKVTAMTFGEAMDSGDKATNKAMSAAYKYAAFQTFCIPTEGDNDADKTTHEVAAKAPEGFDEWWLDMEATADNGLPALQAAWTASSKELRKHAQDTRKSDWDALKKKAEAKTPKEPVAA